MASILLFLLLSGLQIASGAIMNVSTTGDDTGNCRDRPCRTISRAADIAVPGDIIQVGPGLYPERVVVTRSGSAGSPITFRGYSNGGTCPSTVLRDTNSRGARPAPTVTNWGFFLKSDYVTVECFRIIARPSGSPATSGDTFGGFSIFTGKHDLTMNDNVIDASATPGDPSVGIQFGYLANAMPYNISASRNYVKAAGYGFTIYCASNCTFTNNEVDGLKTTPAGGADLDYSRIFGSGITMRRNYYHGNAVADCNGCHIDCFQTWNIGNKNEFAQNILLDGNACFNAHQGIIVRDTTSGTQGTYVSHYNWTVTNNVFAFGPVGSGMAWCALFEHAGNVQFRHNLCYMAGQVGYMNGTSGVHQYNIHHSSTPYNSSGSRTSAPASITAGQNIIYTPGKSFSASDYASDQVNVDPMFVDINSLDFRLAEKSPGWNTAINSTVAIDKVGVSRPQGSAPDIGPFEKIEARYRTFQISKGSDAPNHSNRVDGDTGKDEEPVAVDDDGVVDDSKTLSWEFGKGSMSVYDSQIRFVKRSCTISSVSVKANDPTSLRLVAERSDDPVSGEWETLSSGAFGLIDALGYGDTALSDWKVGIPADSAIRLRLLPSENSTMTASTDGEGLQTHVRAYLRCD
jgi:hypothetical protein